MAISPYKLEELSRQLDQGQYAKAESELLKLGRISPGDANIAGLLVTLFAQTGRFEQAVFAAERRAALLPHDLGAQLAVVDILLAAKRQDDGIARARKIYERHKNAPQAVLLLTSALLHIGKAAESASILAERLEAGVRTPDLMGTRASALLAMGRTREAAEILRAILAQTPEHPFALSLLATVLNYVPGTDPAEHFRLHAAYGKSMQKFSSGGVGSDRKAISLADGRPLIVGLLSADLHEHSVARFLEPIVKHADRKRVRIVLISMGMSSDDTSKRLATLADTWRDLRPMRSSRLAEIAAEEKIDVLIELGGHMTNTPLPLMIPRIAPVQGSAIGYPNTTGLPTIDFRIVDSITDPPGASDALATEKLVRIDPCFLCFQPPIAAPDVSGLPAQRNGFVTFGSFNSLSKVSDEQLHDWAELLRRVPGSRFHLKALAIDDEGTRHDLSGRASKAGIAPDRLTLIGKKKTTREHLECYSEVDIALDTFPYHGTTTTCEALWMGVPVISHAGVTHASRVGASLLHAVGLPEWVAADRDHTFTIAAALAGDSAKLASIRAGLRERVRTSVLCDGAAYAKRWEDAVLKSATETLNT